jgi:lysophospholipase L1-like esterase
MTAKNFTEIAAGSPAKAETVNDPLGELDAAIGDLTTLGTTPKTSVAGAIGVGTPSTTAQTIVAAINELYAKLVADAGDVSTLNTTPHNSLAAAIGTDTPNTTAKTIVAAINEINTLLAGLGVVQYQQLDYSIDFSNVQNAVAPPWPLAGGAVASGKLIITPSPSSEHLVDPGFSDPGGWIPSGHAVVSGGELVIAGGVSYEQTQSYNNVYTSYGWYRVGFEISNYTSGTISLYASSNLLISGKHIVGSYVATGRLKSAPAVKLILSCGNTNTTLKLTSATVKEILMKDMISVFSNLIKDVRIKASWTIADGFQAGIICNLDSKTSPANFVLADHNRTNAYLIKCVAGVYTELIAAAATYVADADIEIRKNGTTYQLWYNNVQIGADQTITDAGIINNTIHGAFSTDASNLLSRLSVVDNLETVAFPVAYLGGSITFGSDSGDDANLSYAALSYRWLSSHYPTKVFAYHNAGIGGTGSWYGLTRLAADVIAYNPRVVFLDFAVNDSASTFRYQHMEALIRRIRTLLPNALIFGTIFIEVADHTGSDATNLLEAVAAVHRILFARYGIRYADYSAEVQAEVAALTHPLSWFFDDDDIHPGPNGHALAYNLLIPLMRSLDAGIVTLPDRLYDCADFEQPAVTKLGTDYSSKTGTWTTVGGKISTTDTGTPATVTYSGTFRSFGIDDGAMGLIDCYYQLDGAGGWTEWASTYPYQGTDLGTRATRTITFKIKSGTFSIDKLYLI